MKNYELLCTLGPSSMNTRVIKQLENLNASIFRINLSHTKISEVESTIKFIQDRTSIPVCLDTEGAQVRTADNFPKEIRLVENSMIRLSRDYVLGSATEINLHPRKIVEKIELGDFINIDFNSALGQVVKKDIDGAILRIINGGTVGKNKAVTIQRAISLPPLTEKDIAAIAIGLKMGVRHYALSFANTAADVEYLRSMIGSNAFLISKIESLHGLNNLAQIGAASDALLIDRGDLSREVPIEQIPSTQKMITEQANKIGVKLYVATNLLESMIDKPFPTRAEVNDIYTTLSNGADGLVLAAETAIGKYPAECAKMISNVIGEYQKDLSHPNDEFILSTPKWLIEPHGGTLLQQYANSEELEELDEAMSITVDSSVMSDCITISNGTFSPLTGFMDRETLRSVLEENLLPAGIVWTMPVLLPVSSTIAKNLSVGQTVQLISDNGQVAIIKLSDIFQYDIDILANGWFGTSSKKHPGVERVMELGNYFLAGAIKMATKVSAINNPYNMTPEQCRFVFSHKGWRHIVGFHTRNVPHRAHEYIMQKALEQTNADGLFINPVFGVKKSGDFLSAAIMKSYQVLFESGAYEEGQAVFGSLSTYSRYAGPREAVFTALIRKNMGCDYFIVGRDHTGVGDFYGSDSSQRLFDELGDIGITPIYFDTIGFDHKTKRYAPLGSSHEIETISGTRFREALISGKMVPEWLVRPEIQEVLLSELDRGRKIFYE